MGEPSAELAGGAPRPRVLHVMESTIGGTRRHLVDVALGQRAQGLDVHVVAAAERQSDFRADLERLRAAGVGVQELAMVRAISPAHDARDLLFLERELRRLRPDVLHTHSSKAGVLGRLASLATGIGRRVHTPHTFAFLFAAMFGPLKRRLFFELERGLSGLTERVVAVSGDEAELFVRSGVVEAARVRIVPNGIDPAPWITATPLPRAELGLGEGRTAIGVIGLLNAAKGQDLALEALARPGLEACDLVLVGHGELEQELRERARALGLERRVVWLGFRRDVPRILASLDLLLLPSRWEGLPYVVLEALAAGRPVVASPVAGARELLTEGVGIVAREISADALAEALRVALADTPAKHAARCERGRARVLGHYSAQAMVRGLVDVYEELLGTRP